MADKVVGILGGMGPEATADLFRKIILATKVKQEQDHLRIIIDNNPKIPDRTEFIQGKGKSPLPALIETAQNLEKAGVDFIVIPCNTAHHYYKQIQKIVSIPILNLIEETAKEVSRQGWKRIGLLAYSGTVITGLYQKSLAKRSLETIVPFPKEQELVTETIKAIKIGDKSEELKKRFLQIADQLVERGAQGLILGCTDIEVLLEEKEFPVPALDTVRILAEAAVREAKE